MKTPNRLQPFAARHRGLLFAMLLVPLLLSTSYAAWWPRFEGPLDAVPGWLLVMTSLLVALTVMLVALTVMLVVGANDSGEALQLGRGRVAPRPRTVSIEDLLYRDPVELNSDALRRWIAGRVVMVTGSAGSIGAELCRQLLAFSPRQLIAVDRSENGQFYLQRELQDADHDCETVVCVGDTCDARRMQTLFDQYGPEIVFHAAAYKHVPMMEANTGEAVKNITIATRTIADLADRNGAETFVLISTDKAVRPTSVMGCCKRAAELYVQSLDRTSDCRFVTVRFGNVLDSAGSVVPVFREQIARGGPLTVTHPDMTRYFMTIPEASQLVIQSGAMGQGGEVFVLDMGRPIRILDLAADMVRLSGLELGRDIKIEFTGIRPGEKLNEQLHCDDETHGPTEHPKIMVSHTAPCGLASICRSLDQLAMVSDAPREVVIEELRQLVAEYEPRQPVVRSELQRHAA